MALRQSLKNWYLRRTEFKWVVGVAEYSPETILDKSRRLKIHWVKNLPRESWFADPFILSAAQDKIYLLVEEFVYTTQKGRISKLVVNRHSWTLEQVIPIIDISTHLSFPAYFRENGKVYIYPESSRSGKLTLYEYDEGAETTSPVNVLSNYPLADGVFLDAGEKRYIMATTLPRDNGKVLDLYPVAAGPDAGPELQIAFKTNVARNAGVPFSVNGRQIRPAQDCTDHYGSCVVLQEIVKENDNFVFKELRRLHSPLPLYREAFHTFNVFEDRLAAVDAQGFRFGLFAQMLYHIRESFRK